jgi:hypothetical protein
VIDSKPPYNFNWVPVRYTATPDGLFDLLQAMAEENVNTRNGQLAEGRAAAGFELSGPNEFKVWSHTDKNLRARFVRAHSGVMLFSGFLEPHMILTARMDDDGRCRVTMDGVDYEPWQLLMHVLAPVLFAQ